MKGPLVHGLFALDVSAVAADRREDHGRYPLAEGVRSGLAGAQYRGVQAGLRDNQRGFAAQT